MHPFISSSKQTKKWRLGQSWYTGGKRSECERFQVECITSITKNPLYKTSERLNLNTLELSVNRCPLKNKDGFDWTEDFDRMQIANGIKWYYNLKMVCDVGGAQTRSLREVYHFVKGQLEYLLHNDNIGFINILEGDASSKHMDKFKYLLSNPKYVNAERCIFCGDMIQFNEWYNSREDITRNLPAK
jgi:hypothetical protein